MVRLPRCRLGEREPLVAEVGDDLQPPTQGLDVGSQRPELCRAYLGVLDRGRCGPG
jgi:hypothetical protein